MCRLTTSYYYMMSDTLLLMWARPKKYPCVAPALENCGQLYGCSHIAICSKLRIQKPISDLKPLATGLIGYRENR
jgi:hypothetical protein